MTIADTLIEKGKEIGKEIGVRKERQEIALKLLRAGTDESFITEITGLTPLEIQALRDEFNRLEGNT